MKTGGYSDSGADIAFALRGRGVDVVTPAQHPSELNDLDWVFPDSVEGIEWALGQGAEIFWLNTVLYEGHPIERYFGGVLEIIGQSPQMVDLYDDKLITNKLLAEHGLPVPENEVLKQTTGSETKVNLPFPLVVKPIRGRGSQGVSLVENMEELNQKLDTLFANEAFGDTVYVERYLPGQEITVTVLPGGTYELDGIKVEKAGHWSMPPVKRFNHHHGVAPYNGVVAVTYNSIALEDAEVATPEIMTVLEQCAKAAELINAKAPIRIDCRADESGRYYLFDVNMKPNMTGASRSHRKDQDGLSTISARKLGWSYEDFLMNIFNQRWCPVIVIIAVIV